MAFSMTQLRKGRVRWKLCVFTIDSRRFCGISQMFGALAVKYRPHDCHLIIGALASARQEEGEPKDCNFRFVKESFRGMLHRSKRPCFSITSHVSPIWRLFNLRFHCRCGRSSCRSPFKWLMLLSPVSTPGSSEFHFLSASNGDFYYFANTSRVRSVSVVQLHLSRPRTRVKKSSYTFLKSEAASGATCGSERRYWFVLQLVRGDRAATQRSRAISARLCSHEMPHSTPFMHFD